MRTPRRSPASRKPPITSRRTRKARSSGRPPGRPDGVSTNGGLLNRRVVITGIGLVSALGIGTRETWAALLAGQSGVTRITRFDVSGYATQIAAEVKGFDPLAFLEKKEIKKMDL